MKDETRSDATICLAVSPALMALGVPGRPRLFEAKQKIADQNIIHQTRPVPSRPRMPRQNRAKISAPYDALKGFQETAHGKDAVYVPRMELPEDMQEQLDRKLRGIRRNNRITVTWFQPSCGDPCAELGQYVTVSGVVEQIDSVFRVVFIGGQAIHISDIAEIRE